MRLEYNALKQLLPALTAAVCILLLPARAICKAPVYVTASFLGKNSMYLEDLNRDEVRILEDNQPREIEFMAREELPTVYGFIFDRGMFPLSVEDERTAWESGSLKISGAASAKSIAYELIDKSLGRQTIWVGEYGNQLTVALEPVTDAYRVKTAIQQLRGTQDSQSPFLYSALFSALAKMNERTEKRRVLLVFLEGVDSETLPRLKPLKNLFSSSNVELFLLNFSSGSAVRTRNQVQPAIARGALKDLGQTTAGEALFLNDYGGHSEDLVRRLFNHLRTLYTFGFESEGVASRPSGLTVQCTRPGSKVKSHPNVPASK